MSIEIPGPVSKRGLWRWLCSFLLAALLFGVFVERARIVEAWPPAGRLYTLLGLTAQSPAAGLEILLLTAQRSNEGGVDVLLIAGRVANVSRESRSVPLLVAVLKDARQRYVQQWTFKAGEGKLLPDEVMKFSTSLKNPASEATDVVLEFLAAEGERRPGATPPTIPIKPSFEAQRAGSTPVPRPPATQGKPSVAPPHAAPAENSPLLTLDVAPLDLLTDQDEPLVVSVNARGNVYLQDTEIPINNLAAGLQEISQNRLDTRIFVRGDRSINYGRIMEVIGVINQAGFKHMTLVANLPPPLPPAPSLRPPPPLPPAPSLPPPPRAEAPLPPPPKPQQVEALPPPPEPAPEPVPTPQAEKQPESKPQPENTIEKVIKQLAQANLRPSASLDNKMTMSEIDAVRQQIERCWNVPAGAKDAKDLVVDIHVTLNQDGSVREARIVDQSRLQSDAFFREAAESAYRAIFLCQPLRLPPEKYRLWQDMTLSFNPSQIL